MKQPNNRRYNNNGMNRQNGNDGGGYRHRGNNGGGTRNAAAARDKYLNMAREAQGGGDRILAEYYYQHAEHYSRVLNEDGGQQAPREPRERQEGGRYERGGRYQNRRHHHHANGENPAPEMAGNAEAQPAADAGDAGGEVIQLVQPHYMPKTPPFVAPQQNEYPGDDGEDSQH